VATTSAASGEPRESGGEDHGLAPEFAPAFLTGDDND